EYRLAAQGRYVDQRLGNLGIGHCARRPHGTVHQRHRNLAAVLVLMSQDLAIWILILLAWLTATLPFVVERPFVALPWAQQGESERPIWLRWLESLAFFILLAAIGRLGLIWISESLVISGDVGSAAAFLGKLALVVGLLAGLLRSEEHTSELQSRENLVCRLLLEKKKKHINLFGSLRLTSWTRDSRGSLLTSQMPKRTPCPASSASGTSQPTITVHAYFGYRMPIY